MTNFHFLNILITTIVLLSLVNLSVLYYNHLFTEEMKKHHILRFFVRDLFSIEKKFISSFTSFLSRMEVDERARKFYASFLILVLIILQYFDHRDVQSMALSPETFNSVWSATLFAPTYAIFMSFSMLITLCLLPYRFSNSILNFLHKRKLISFIILCISSSFFFISYATLSFFKTVAILLMASYFYPSQKK